MARPTHETLLISAILNSGDVHLAQNLGIRPEHFSGHRNEYQWILNFYTQFQGCPTPSEFLTVFPALTYDLEQVDGRAAAHYVKREYNRKDLRDRILRAGTALARDDVEEAFNVFDGFRLEVTAQRPNNALLDHNFLDDYTASHEPRIPVPWDSLQKRTDGIGPGELWYWAARQGHGKSSFLIDMAVEAAMAGRSVIMYSLEMTKRQTQVRAHAALGRRLGLPVNSSAMLRRTWDHANYKNLLQQIEERVPGKIAVHEVSMGLVTPSVVDTNAQEFDLSIVDYIGLMRNDDRVPAIKDYRIIAEISNSLKSTALGRHHSIIAASQINREGVSAHWKPPALHTLAQSDHLGNDGDVVLTMKRYGMGAAVCSIEKNRHGQSGTCFWNVYDPNNGDFREITRDQADEIREEEDV